MRAGRLIFVASLAAVGCNLLTGVSDLVVGEAPPVDPLPLGDDGSAPGVDGSNPLPDGKPPKEDASEDTRRDVVGSDARDVVASDTGSTAKRVFVTSTLHTGDYNGLANADLVCNGLATDAALGGTWVAWLSTSAKNAEDRLTAAGPWYLLDGTLVGTKAQLSGTTIAHAIDIDESKTKVPNDEVWTGTRLGKYYLGDCNLWNAASPYGGTIGTTNTNAASWTASTEVICSQAHRLYCFEN